MIEETDKQPKDEKEGLNPLETDDEAFEEIQLVDKSAELEAEIAELKDKLLRAMAETENTRRRAERDKLEASKYGGVKLARDMVSIADNLERALGYVGDDLRESAADFVAGLEATLRETQAVFQRHQIQQVGTVGEKFDPKLHQAMVEIPTSEFEIGQIVQVMQVGYVMEERLLRPAMVGVAKQPPADVDEASSQTA